MKQLLIVAALLTFSGCAAGPPCDTRLTPINTSMSRVSAAATAVGGAAHQLARRHAPRGGRS